MTSIRRLDADRAIRSGRGFVTGMSLEVTTLLYMRGETGGLGSGLVGGLEGGGDILDSERVRVFKHAGEDGVVERDEVLSIEGK